MKKQSVKARLHEHLGETHRGKKKESMKSRTKESEGMEKAEGHSPKHAIKSERKSKKTKRK